MADRYVPMQCYVDLVYYKFPVQEDKPDEVKRMQGIFRTMALDLVYSCPPKHGHLNNMMLRLLETRTFALMSLGETKEDIERDNAASMQEQKQKLQEYISQVKEKFAAEVPGSELI